MGERPTLKKISEEADQYGKKCKKCGHIGLKHMKQKYQNPGRERGPSGEFGKCSTCDSEGKRCDEFVPE